MPSRLNDANIVTTNHHAFAPMERSTPSKSQWQELEGLDVGLLGTDAMGATLTGISRIGKIGVGRASLLPAYCSG